MLLKYKSRITKLPQNFQLQLQGTRPFAPEIAPYTSHCRFKNLIEQDNTEVSCIVYI